MANSGKRTSPESHCTSQRDLAIDIMGSDSFKKNWRKNPFCSRHLLKAMVDCLGRRWKQTDDCSRWISIVLRTDHNKNAQATNRVTLREVVQNPLFDVFEHDDRPCLLPGHITNTRGHKFVDKVSTNARGAWSGLSKFCWGAIMVIWSRSADKRHPDWADCASYQSTRLIKDGDRTMYLLAWH
ncbi:hypothetical protein B0H34DRAFT_252492 [Crassisporium funariophilum]|nr:hypothetical protein B0H34DRAFT_252492 [Crassisporium funariophilum]